MKVEKIPDVRPAPKDEVTLKTAGNVMEIRYASNTAGSPIQKLDKDHGLDTRTGEVIDYQHNQNRAGDMASVAQSLKRLRDLINANLENPDTALWVTLTYAFGMKGALLGNISKRCRCHAPRPCGSAAAMYSARGWPSLFK